jgi:hypothetical protein
MPFVSHIEGHFLTSSKLEMRMAAPVFGFRGRSIITKNTKIHVRFKPQPIIINSLPVKKMYRHQGFDG